MVGKGKEWAGFGKRNPISTGIIYLSTLMNLPVVLPTTFTWAAETFILTEASRHTYTHRGDGEPIECLLLRTVTRPKGPAKRFIYLQRCIIAFSFPLPPPQKGFTRTRTHTYYVFDRDAGFGLSHPLLSSIAYIVIVFLALKPP